MNKQDNNQDELMLSPSTKIDLDEDMRGDTMTNQLMKQYYKSSLKKNISSASDSDSDKFKESQIKKHQKSSSDSDNSGSENENENKNYKSGQNILISNPLYVSLLSEKNELFGLNIYGILKQYKDIYIICLRDDFINNATTIPLELFKTKISLKQIDELKKYFTIVKGNIRMLDNPKHRRLVKKIPYPIINKLTNELIQNIQNIDDDDDNNNSNDECLTLLFLDQYESNVKKYVSMYHTESLMNEIIEMKKMLKYYLNNGNYHIIDNYRSMYYNLPNVDYWTKKRNCDLTIAHCFDDRTFHIKRKLSNEQRNVLLQSLTEPKNSDLNIKDLIRMSNNSDEKKNNNTTYGEMFYKKTKFIDLSRTITKTMVDPITKENITKLLFYSENIAPEKRNADMKEFMKNFLSASTDYEKYDIIFTTLMNPKKSYCFMDNVEVFKNEEIQLILKKYAGIYAYVFGYAWAAKLLEEAFRKESVKSTDTCVIDISVASLYPVFPYCTEEPNANPYNLFLINKEQLNAKENFQGLKMLKNYTACNINYGIASLDDFKTRLNIFVSGNDDIDVFKGLDWNNIAITGSAMTFCLPKLHPFILSFGGVGKEKETTSAYKKIAEQLYLNADLDIMIHTKNNVDFIDKMNNIIKTVTKNISECKRQLKQTKASKIKKEQKNSPTAVDVTSKKTLLIIFSLEFMKIKMKKWTPEYIIKNLNRPIIRSFFYTLYIKLKEGATSKRKDDLEIYDDAHEIVQYSDMILLPIVNDVKEYQEDEDVMSYYYKKTGFTNKLTNDPTDSIMMKIVEGLKYKVDFKSLKRSFEVFRVKKPDFIKTIYKFHYDCVHSYFNGETVKILASGISMMNTFTSFVIKCLIGVVNPIDIFNKYYARGYGVLLNKTEISEWYKHTLRNNEQNLSICSTGKKGKIVELNPQIFGGIELKNVRGNEDAEKREYVNTMNDLKEEYSRLFNYDWKKDVTIDILNKVDINGFLIPLNKNIVLNAFSKYGK